MTGLPPLSSAPLFGRRLAAALALVVFAGTGPALAQSGEQRLPEAFERDMRNLEAATQQIMQALNVFLLAIPQYEAPVVLDNGDILIRRRNPQSLPHGDRQRPIDPFELFERFGRELERGGRPERDYDRYERDDREMPRTEQGEGRDRDRDPMRIVPGVPDRDDNAPRRLDLPESDWDLKT